MRSPKLGATRRGRRRLWVMAVVVALSGATLAPLSPVSAEGVQASPLGSRTATALESEPRSSLSATELRVNDLADPLGLGDASPTLSWRPVSHAGPGSSAAHQTAYEIRVASGPARLDDPDLWDSGKVASSDTRNIAYDGRPLHSRQHVVWAVRVWDGNGHASAWSAPATWEMGLLDRSDWSAEWIEDPQYTYATDGVPNPLPVFAKEFAVGHQVAKARLYMTGLGQYAARLNGSPVGNAVLEPGQTSYWAEVDYRTYDVTHLLRSGANVLGIETGSGAYQQADSTPMGRYMFQPGNNTVLGTPKAIAQLEVTYRDGTTKTIGTDSSWLARSGATTFSSWWGGEDYDARRMPVDWTGSTRSLAGPAWHSAGPAELSSSSIPRADTPLVADPRPPVTVAREAHPTAISEVKPPANSATLVAPAQSGATNVKVTSVTHLYPGDTIDIGTGADMESRKVTAVGTAAGPVTKLATAAAAGAVNIKVDDVGRRCDPGASCEGTTSFVVGQSMLIGSGASQEAVTVTAVGTEGASGSGVTFTPALSEAHAGGTSVRDAGTGVTFEPALSRDHADGSSVGSVPGPTYVLDFGANLSGLPEISGDAPAGTTVTMIPAEEAHPDGTVDIGSTGARPTSQILYHYTFARGGSQSWHAQFTYNGFRYLEVHGLPDRPTADTVTLLVTHASNRETASFDSSSELLDSIYRITKRALENNMQSVLTDCPDREKGPYTGDNLHNIDTSLTLFDLQAYQSQLVANMRTSQRPTPLSSDFPGLIANIAPEYHVVPWKRFLDEPNWGGAVIRIPWQLYQVYGDTEVMRDNYDAMVKWLDYEVRNKADNGGNIPGLGDWSSAQHTDPQAIIDYGYYRGVSTMAKIARVLGKASDVEKYSQLAADLKDEYNAKYLHTDDSGRAWYANDTEASNAVALDAGLVPDQYRPAVVDSLTRAVSGFGDRIGTGSVALGPLFRALHDSGNDALIYAMVTNPASPGYAFLVNSGKTTLTESLDGSGSQDHHFLGEVASWFVHALAGIDQAPGTRAYRKLLIRPAMVGDLGHVTASYTTPAGRAAVDWTHTPGGRVVLRTTVPANTTAEIWIPTFGQEVTAPSGARFSRTEQFGGMQYAVYDAGPGHYTFTAGGR